MQQKNARDFVPLCNKMVTTPTTRSPGCEVGRSEALEDTQSLMGRGGALGRVRGTVAGADADARAMPGDEAELMLDAGGEAAHNPRRGQGAGGGGEDGELGLTRAAHGVGGAASPAERGGHPVVVG